MDVARSFRDRVLAKSDRGNQYTRLYYHFSRDAVRIMLSDPILLLRSRDIVTRYKSVLERIIKGEPVTLSQDDLDDIDEFLARFSEKAGPEIKGAFDRLRKDLRDPAVHREFSISITHPQEKYRP